MGSEWGMGKRAVGSIRKGSNYYFVPLSLFRLGESKGKSDMGKLGFRLPNNPGAWLG